MFPTSLTAIELFGKKRDISLYKAKDTSHHYLLKSIITEDSSIKQAFYDEYHTLSQLSQPLSSGLLRYQRKFLPTGAGAGGTDALYGRPFGSCVVLSSYF